MSVRNENRLNTKELLIQLQSDYPGIIFKIGEVFSWSPDTSTITYRLTNDTASQWSILHEVAHGILNHQDYGNDIDLVKIECEAWERARQIAIPYGIIIDEDYLQDCLDTYREWLHKRSTCPTCSNISTQDTTRTYQCFNCKSRWTVSSSTICRPYRSLILF